MSEPKDWQRLAWAIGGATVAEHVITWTARAGHRAHWRCSCGQWCTANSRCDVALDVAEVAARAHVESYREPTP